MGLFDDVKSFFNVSGDSGGDWETIANERELSYIRDKSGEKPQLIYKHSSMCSISWMAKNELDSVYDELEERADLYAIEVNRQRDISNRIASEFGVRHESPQILIIHMDEVIWHASHSRVRGEKAIEILANLRKAS